ncbi:MAG TPA: mechanosensitive ion channel [Phycisphaerae bacterium]|nr:mechanosensitive ion channel [Phycisphaerae bacterium]HNU44612.1 mechanosensitive ion channel [Phycisphaerae bacterium]
MDTVVDPATVAEQATLMTQVTAWVDKYGPAVLQALVTLVVGWIVARVLRRVLRGVLKRAHLDPTLVGFLSHMVYLLLLVLVILTALGRVGVQTTSFIAILGAAGLAVGLALQGSLANLAAGVMIIAFRPFRAGDFIEAAGTKGVVDEVQVFATILRHPDNKIVIVPNSALASGVITKTPGGVPAPPGAAAK